MSGIPIQTKTWTDLATERARLDAAEDAADAAGNEAEADALQCLRHAAEDKLMAIPSPDGAGLALKVLIAIGQDRASIPYQKEIEADAVRLAAGAANAAKQCNRCRFWLLAEDGAPGSDEEQPYGWGWCRRNPPQLSERMSGMLIPSLGNTPGNYDPENVATVSRVSDCSLFPATWHDKWCGEFAPTREA